MLKRSSQKRRWKRALLRRKQLNRKRPPLNMQRKMGLKSKLRNKTQQERSKMRRQNKKNQSNKNTRSKK